MDQWELIVVKIESLVQEIYSNNPDIEKLDVITNGPIEDWGGHYKTVPYWRCQPYFRKVDGVKQNTALLKMVGENELIKSIPQANNKRQLEDESNDDEGHSKLKKQATLVQN